MRKTIDELKRELSTSPSQSTFRILTRQEQSYYWGQSREFSPIVFRKPPHRTSRVVHNQTKAVL